MLLTGELYWNYHTQETWSAKFEKLQIISSLNLKKECKP